MSRADCPECGGYDWHDLGCANCGLEFWPPSEAYWAHATISKRVAALWENWPDPGPCAVTLAQERVFEQCGIPDPVGEMRTTNHRPVPERELPASASPIEKKFWAACRRLLATSLDGLVFQHPVIGYRIDFALPDRKIGIELDGFRSHSSTEDIEKDRLRQRILAGHGWYIIRFGGREVTRDADYCAQQAAWLAEHARGG